MHQPPDTMNASPFHLPCTGHVAATGFGAFLDQELGEPRRNLTLLAKDLGTRFDAPLLSLLNSGSSANLAAALALAERTGPGEALAAGFSFPTTLSSLLTAGYDVRLIDTEIGGFAMDPAALVRAITPRTRLVCVTHFLGFPARLDIIREICDRHGIVLLQDACESMGLPIGGAPAHARGDLTTWSFYHPHHLSSYGGGAVIALDRALWQIVESISHWGRACRCHLPDTVCPVPPGIDHHFWYVRQGHNLELSELNAAFGRWQLQTFPAQETRRLEHYSILADGLQGTPGLTLQNLPAEGYSPFVFPITTGWPIQPFADALRESGIMVRSLMGGCIARHPAYQHLRTDGLNSCMSTGERSCFLGIHQTLDTNALRQAVPMIRAIAARVIGGNA